MKNLFNINLSPKTQSEVYAWMTCAILAHTQMDVRFIQSGAELAKEIKMAPDAFLKVVDELQQENAFGFIELTSEDADELKRWVKSS